MKYSIFSLFLLTIGGAEGFTTTTTPSFRIARPVTTLAPLPSSISSCQRKISLKDAASSSSSLCMSSEAAAEGDAEKEVGGGTATIPNEIFNLVKGIVGAGVLSLPAGIAAYGNAPSAVIPATILIALIGVISGYGFSLIGRVCSYTGATSYRDAWDKSVGPNSSWIPAASCTFKTSCAILAYSMILADTFQALLTTVGFSTITRSQSLFGVTGLFLLPLCLLKNLSSLAPFSLLGIIGMLYTAVAMAMRYLGKAYHVPTGGKFLADVPANLQPSFGTTGATGVLQPSSFILISMLSTAYMAHFNAPKFYTELKNNTLERYNKVVSSSFAISIGIFALVAGLGFLTFGSACSGLILNNYSTKDAVMSFSRVAVAVSIVFSYPLAFVGARDGILDVFNVSQSKRSNALLNKVTVAILSAITALALKVKDLSFVLSFAGATLGNALIYVYPALMFRKAVKNMGDDASKGLKVEVKFAMLSAILGVVMGGIGSVMAVKNLLAG
uniref:Amino acid transporter transmembrane domain-containing protein n=2 Tax=Ditylum brightwellii TaxID=49249 RepID=A0A6S9BYX4_9STRA|mmetsp:Transcript_27891/g.41506  ORF Transcript_27891/g.41506 Transcript_27891/m.41506 type:complete len:500 (-) Transcript_27891:169-1668(-)